MISRPNRIFLEHPRKGLNFDLGIEGKWTLQENGRRATTRDSREKLVADFESPCTSYPKSIQTFFSGAVIPPASDSRIPYTGRAR